MEELKAKKLRIDNWREKEATKAEVKIFIQDFLWDDHKGLPETYTPDEVQSKVTFVFEHIFKQYSDAFHHAYAA